MSKGFTLAEVLITLGVIGIVAAMTMPAIITNYQQQETISRLKKSYSIVQQAIKRSEVDNGEIINWETTNNGNDFFNKYIKNYVQFLSVYTASELWDIAPRKLMNGNNYTGTTYAAASTTTSHFVLSDGSMITLNYVTPAIWVGIDTNGIKKPNQLGKDTFLFIFTSKNGLQPLGGDGTPSGWSYGEYSRNTIKGTNSFACNRKSSGYWCSALIMNDEWTIAKDYPW